MEKRPAAYHANNCAIPRTIFNLPGINPDILSGSFSHKNPNKVGRDGFRQGIVDLYAAFPDFHGAADCFVIDEKANTVAIRWKASGTHKGAFLGAAPAGRRITFEGIEIIRVDRDQIVERWGEWDAVEIMQQLKPAPESLGAA